MPHLSPMKWLLTLFLLWSIILLMTTSTWWSYHPMWPYMTSSKQLHSNQWLW